MKSATLTHSVGLLLTALIGSTLATYTVSGAGSLIIASFGVTIAARLYSYYIRRRYLLYVYGGLLVLVPGSVSVRGFIGIWAGDSAAATEFTLLMLTNCICLALGVFLGMIPRKRWMIWRRQKFRECVSFISQICCSAFDRVKAGITSFCQTHLHILLPQRDVDNSRAERQPSLDALEISVIEGDHSDHNHSPIHSASRPTPFSDIQHDRRRRTISSDEIVREEDPELGETKENLPSHSLLNNSFD